MYVSFSVALCLLVFVILVYLPYIMVGCVRVHCLFSCVFRCVLCLYACFVCMCCLFVCVFWCAFPMCCVWRRLFLPTSVCVSRLVLLVVDVHVVLLCCFGFVLFVLLFVVCVCLCVVFGSFSLLFSFVCVFRCFLCVYVCVAHGCVFGVV